MNKGILFYKCEICGNVVVILNKRKGELYCCNKQMKGLKANVTEASFEKHIPVAVKENGNIKVQVGSNIHPMTENHYIEWIAIVEDGQIEIKTLTPNDEPKASFCNKEKGKIYAYCNLHGLWESDIN